METPFPRTAVDHSEQWAAPRLGPCSVVEKEGSHPRGRRRWHPDYPSLSLADRRRRHPRGSKGQRPEA